MRFQYDCDSRVMVYTDGHCFNNGGSYARAGYGVFWNDDHPDNASFALKGDVQTNQRAELQAAIAALQIASRNGISRLRIYSDSQYVVKGATDLIYTWRNRGWRNSSGRPVANQDLWRRLARAQNKLRDIVYEHVRGHAGNYGNEQADRLANEGADEGYYSEPDYSDSDSSDYDY